MTTRVNAIVAQFYSAARVLNTAARDAHAAGLKIEVGVNTLEVVEGSGPLPQISVQAFLPLTGEEVPQ